MISRSPKPFPNPSLGSPVLVWHVAALLGLALSGLALLNMPLALGLLMIQPVIPADVTGWALGGLAAYAAGVVLVRRGHPWYHTVAGGLISAAHLGLLAAVPYMDDWAGVPLWLLLFDLAALAYLVALAVRPNVYEERDEAVRAVAERDLHLQAVEARHETEMKRLGEQARHFEALYYELRDLRKGEDS